VRKVEKLGMMLIMVKYQLCGFMEGRRLCCACED